MKIMPKKLLLAITTVLCSLCLLFGFVFVFSQTTSVKADTATLEAEFTNDGQFTVSMYNNAVPFEYVDGETEGLPAGYDGAVLKITTTSGVAYATLDFSASQILAADVESIVVRMYSPGYTSADEFRTNVGSDATYQVQYGVGAYDMSAWCDVTLNATSMSTMTDANGYLANISVGTRVKGGAAVYYIDSVTVITKADLESEFTNNGQFVVGYYTGNEAYAYQFVDGATEGLPAGYDGAVLKITTTSGVAYTTLDFSASQILAADVESIVVRMYSPDFTLGTDEFRTYPTQVQYGTSGYDMSVSWCDITLNQTTMADMTDENGYLSTISVGVREKDTSKTIYYYIDSITIKLAAYGTPTFSAATAGMVGAWDWNHQTENTAVVKDTNYGYTIVADWSMTANATNLAASENLTSRSITLNGTPFYELYQADDGYRLNAQLGYFAFSVPTAALVASNGYAYPTIEIVEGTLFYSGNYLPETTLIYKDGAWQLGEKIEALEKAVFIGPWGSIGIYNSSEQVLLQYSSESDWDYTNEGDLATKITYRNSETNASYSATESNIVGWDGQKWIVLSGMTGYDVIEIAEGGTFGGVEIPAVTLYNVNGCWVTTAPSASATTNYMAIADGWNNNVANGLSNNVLSFDVKPLGDAADATNLAATLNRTSLMVKYNGKTFCELYASDNAYAISYAHGSRYFYFAIPEADLVEDAIFEIEEGTPFANQSLGGVQLVYNGSEWEVYVETNYNPDYVSIGTLNHYDNGDMGFGLSLKYDTNGFTTDGNQVMAASYTGVTVNGEAQSVALWGGDQLLFWIAKDKCEAGYNGYSHATLVIEEGAKIVNDSGEEFTLGAATLYLVDGAWTTTQPDGYKVLTPTSYVEIAWNNIDYGDPAICEQVGLSGGILALINYYVPTNTENNRIKDNQGSYGNLTNLVAENSDAGNKICINGVPLKDAEGAFVGLVSGYVFIYVPVCEVLTIEAGTDIYGHALPATTLYFSGSWSEVEPTYSSVSFVEIEWNNYDYNGESSIFGQESHTGKPTNGFCGLFEYNEQLSSSGAIVISNMATEYLDIGSKFKVNGVAAKDIEGAYISYNLAQQYVYFYIPYSGLTQADVYTVTIESGAKFMNAALPATTHYFYDGEFHDSLPIVVTVQYGELTISNRFSGEQTIDSEYLANAISDSASSICPLVWTVGGQTYYAGESVTVSETTTVVINDAAAFETVRGAAVRITNDGNYGIRFESRIGLDSYNALVEKYGESNIKTGTYIAPKALFDTAGLSIAAYFAQEKGEGSSSKYVHLSNFDVEKNANGIYNKDTYQTDGYIRFFGSLTNLNDSNYYTQFFGVGYITITIGEKTVTVYGLTDLSKTNRTIYDVATMAYSDLEEEYSEDAVTVLEHYINSVAMLSYSNGNLFADTDVTGREYASVYTVTEISGGYMITSDVQPKAIVVNGGKISSIDVTESAGAYSFTLASDYLEENFGSSLQYGLAEPNYKVWGDGIVNENMDVLLAGIAGEMGVNSYRVWVNNQMGSAGAGNVVSIAQGPVSALKSHVKALVDAGVKEISFANGSFVYLYDYPLYIVTNNTSGEQEWVSYETLLGGGYTQIIHDSNIVPDPATEAEAYTKWLKAQYDYYVLFAEEVKAWKAEYGWTDSVVKFYFEGINEPEFQDLIHKRGTYTDGTYTFSYYNTTEMAKILTDVSYYMTLAIGDAGYVTTPALTNISSGSAYPYAVNGVYCDALLAAMYEQINDSVAPTAISGITPENINDENAYFTCLNWHPYLPWFKDEHQEMYYGEIKTESTWWGSTTTSAVVNSSYADMWVAWNNGMYNIAVNGGDVDSPKVFFSELGVCDWGNPTNSSDYRTKMGINEELAATVFKTLLGQAGDLEFVDELTVMAFRVFDNPDKGEGEGNFGFIDEEGQLKAIAKEYYLIINGDDDTSALQATIDKYYD